MYRRWKSRIYETTRWRSSIFLPLPQIRYAFQATLIDKLRRHAGHFDLCLTFRHKIYWGHSSNSDFITLFFRVNWRAIFALGISASMSLCAPFVSIEKLTCKWEKLGNEVAILKKALWARWSNPLLITLSILIIRMGESQRYFKAVPLIYNSRFLSCQALLWFQDECFSLTDFFTDYFKSVIRKNTVGRLQ